PGLMCDPGNDGDTVILLGLEVLILEHPVRVAGSTDIWPHARVAMRGEVVEVTVILNASAIAAAVGDVFEYRGDRMARGTVRHENPQGDLHAIAHLHPCRLNLFDSIGTETAGGARRGHWVLWR